MTHACIEALTLNFTTAFYLHPLFPLGLLAVLCAAAVALFPQLARNRTANVIGIVAVVALIAMFVFRVAAQPSFVAPLEYSYDSLVGLLIRLFSA